MEPGLQVSIAIQIVLPEDIAATKSTQPSVVRYSGDDISGYLEVLTRGDFSFEISLSFEGVARTWLASDSYSNPQRTPSTAQFQASRPALTHSTITYRAKFLQEVQNLFSHAHVSHMEDREDSVRVYRLPFRFVVPHNLISARSNVHPEFLKLRPSTDVGMSYRGPISGNLYGQPLITYMIRVNRIKTGLAVPRSMKYYSEREITILPYISPGPPLGVDCFPPNDYQSISRKVLRQHRCGRPLGSLEITAAEPSPLNVLTSALRPCTFAPVNIVFKSQSPHGVGIRPSNWECVVKHHIRTRTFWSTKALEKLPTSATARLDPFVAMRDQNSSSETRVYGNLCWKRGRRDARSELNSDDTDDSCSWETTLTLPISASKTLLPTFLGPLSARQYAIVMRLEIRGMFHGTLELALPLQVICYPTPGGPEESGVERTMAQQMAFSETVQPPGQLLLLENNVEDVIRVRNASPPPYDYC